MSSLAKKAEVESSESAFSSSGISSRVLVDLDIYKELYQESIDNPEGFWAKQAGKIDWIKPFSEVKDCDYSGDVRIKWFADGELNVCANCVDRHLPTKADDVAIIWEGDDPSKSAKITYAKLHEEVCKFANILKNHSVKKGDRVVIYMPMIVEAAYAMLACARIGAVHSVVFGGFSAEALKGRIEDCQASFVITADESRRGGKVIALKDNVDKAVEGTDVDKILVVKNTGGSVTWAEGRDIWYHEEVTQVTSDCPAEVMNAEDPLFILYTSGSTGKPKGVLHSSGGYTVYASMTHQYVFDYRDGDVYWCTADIGWITGHSYIIYGPLANGATTLMFEGVPNYPDWSRYWQIVDKYEVNIFYTAPTAVRALMKEGDKFVRAASRKSLRILASVGEPINPEAWRWYHDVVGKYRCPVIDTWWQTETGGIMIAPLPGAMDLKPGSATLPFFGIKPEIIDDEGKVVEGEGEGSLCIADSWPGQMRTVYGDHKRFVETYFSQYAGKYFTGDGAKRDADGYYWVTGRIDDVLNISGHRLGTAEIESALVCHAMVAEAAVVGFDHDIKGQGIYAFVTLNSGVSGDDLLRTELLDTVKREIGAIAKPDAIQFTPALPKTRSGKIMRRILRKIAGGSVDDLGDTDTLTNPEIVTALAKTRLEV